MRILVVDDNDNVRFVLCKILAGRGHEVLAASDGSEALRLAGEAPPALILLDKSMPGMDGLQFIRAYRQQPGPHAPIVLLTLSMDNPDEEAVAGADDYLPKPFEMERLLELVARYDVRASRP